MDQPLAPVHYVSGGGMRVDTLITNDGLAHTGLVGGNAIYAAVGAAIWQERVHLWARIGDNYPAGWYESLSKAGLDTTNLVRVPGWHDHRTFFAYTPDGRRDDTNPAAHFERIGLPLPEELADYIHSTPGQDDAQTYEPLALRPKDWPAAFQSVKALHLSPMPIRSHMEITAHLRRQSTQYSGLTITVDPGERYMVPELAGHIRSFLPNIDVFLPSEQEIFSLFGTGAAIAEAAEILAGWGAPVVVIKLGAQGVHIYERERDRHTALSPYHRHGDNRVVDSTGAGDAFCGGFMVGFRKNRDVIAAAQMGLVSASLVIEGYGALYTLGQSAIDAQKRLALIKERDRTTG